MLTENMDTDEYAESNLLKMEEVLPDPVLNIKTTLIKPEEVKRYTNRLTEDSKKNKFIHNILNYP